MKLVCGVDEAGRGPLAGPVTASAVILDPSVPIPGLADSKKLSPARRVSLAVEIRDKALDFGIGWASHREIDQINILGATLLAMKRAIGQLQSNPDVVIVDGTHVPEVSIPARSLVRADSQIPAVMAASILAKTARDRWMEEYAELDSRFGFERHKGYPTAAHRSWIRIHGPTAIHRRSFRVS